MLTIAILAGGHSQRMGQDKALKPFLGQPLIARVVERLGPIADEILITTNYPEIYASLGFRCVPDLMPGRGPLGGLYTALAAATNHLVAVAACDMPFANLDLFKFACEILITEKADAVVPSSEKGLEPLHAIYCRTACLPAAKTALDSGEWKIISWFPQINVRILTVKETTVYDPYGLTFCNLNTADEFHKVEKRALKPTRGSSN